MIYSQNIFNYNLKEMANFINKFLLGNILMTGNYKYNSH